MKPVVDAGRILAMLGMILFALAVSNPAQAQFGEAAGIAEAMQPDYYRRDLEIMRTSLKLDETQRVIVRTFFEDYEAEFEAGVERMQGRFTSMKDQLTGMTDQKAILRMVLKPFRDWAVEKGALGEKFLQNVQVVLAPEQMDYWPGMIRRLYRERHLPRGRLSGESVNLLNIVRDLHLDGRLSVQVQPMLEAYEIALDQALRAREQTAGSGQDNLMLQSLEEEDFERQMMALRRYVERQIAVRNVNDEYIEHIASVLPEDIGQEFRASALDRGYPRIYRETPVQRIFKVALELPGLDPGVRQAVFNLQFEFLAELSTINQALHRALRDFEPKDVLDRASDFSRRMAGQTIEPRIDPTRELFTRREDISRNYMRRLRALLTDEQFSMLPGAYRWLDDRPAAATTDVKSMPAPNPAATKSKPDEGEQPSPRGGDKPRGR